MKRLALFDIDGVIYGGYTIFDQIQDQEKRGIIPKGTWDKIILILTDYKSGAKNYTEAANTMLDVSAESIRGMDFDDLLHDTSEYMLRNKNNFFPYFEKLVPFLSKTHDIYFVTTNFQMIPKAIGDMFGVKNFLSSIAGVEKGKFTGKVKLSLSGNKGIVSDLLTKYGVEGSIAVGDSENDADMLDKVELPLVMEPNEKLEKIAKEKGWQIVNRDIITGIITSHVH
jgi:phosphoserine phosphatase